MRSGKGYKHTWDDWRSARAGFGVDWLECIYVSTRSFQCAPCAVPPEQPDAIRLILRYNPLLVHVKIQALLLARCARPPNARMYGSSFLCSSRDQTDYERDWITSLEKCSEICTSALRAHEVEHPCMYDGFVDRYATPLSNVWLNLYDCQHPSVSHKPE